MQILLGTQDVALADLIKKSLHRFHYNWEETQNGFDVFQQSITKKYDLILLAFDLPRMTAIEILRRFRSLDHFKSPPVIVLTETDNQRQEIDDEHFPQTEIISHPISIRKLVSTIQQILHQGVHIACVGGGTGLFTLLSGLKTLSGVSLSSIVAMSDDGGSTGILRTLFGILPPGDVRRSLVALSNAPDLLNELMQYRFKRGAGLEGHNLGNLLLTALSEMRGSMSHAVKSLGEILNIQGQVIPVTETVNTLKAEMDNGVVVEGEHRIDIFSGQEDSSVRIKRLWQEPEAKATLDALVTLFNAHCIILGPGDLYTSIIANLIVGGIAQAVTTSKAKVIYICNVMTKPGETGNYSAADHVREVVRYLKIDRLDYVISSSTQFSTDALKSYAVKGQVPVSDFDAEKMKEATKAKIIHADVASDHLLVRHDSLKLANVLKKIFDESKT